MFFRKCAMSFIYITSFNPPNRPLRWEMCWHPYVKVARSWWVVELDSDCFLSTAFTHLSLDPNKNPAAPVLQVVLSLQSHFNHSQWLSAAATAASSGPPLSFHEDGSGEIFPSFGPDQESALLRQTSGSLGELWACFLGDTKAASRWEVGRNATGRANL